MIRKPDVFKNIEISGANCPPGVSRAREKGNSDTTEVMPYFQDFGNSHPNCYNTFVKKTVHSIHSVPVDLLIQICFPYLGTPSELCVLMQVCVAWNIAARSSLLWKKVYERSSREPAVPTLDPVPGVPIGIPTDGDPAEPLTGFTIVTSPAHFASLCATGRQVADKSQERDRFRRPLEEIRTMTNQVRHSVSPPSPPSPAQFTARITRDYYFLCKQRYSDDCSASEWEGKHALGNVWRYVQSQLRVYFRSLVKRHHFRRERSSSRPATVVSGSSELPSLESAGVPEEELADGDGGSAYVLGALRRAFSRLSAINAESLQACLDRTFAQQADELCKDIIVDVVDGGDMGCPGDGVMEIERRCARFQVWHTNVLLQLCAVAGEENLTSTQRSGSEKRGGRCSGWGDEDDVVEGTLTGAWGTAGLRDVPSTAMEQNQCCPDVMSSPSRGDDVCPTNNTGTAGASGMWDRSDYRVLLRRRVLNHHLIARFLDGRLSQQLH